MLSPPPILAPTDAYALWAASYPPCAHNPLMLAEERAMLTVLPGDLSTHAVLDVGCGSGRYMLHALRRSAHRVTGVDLSGEMLDRACGELKAVARHDELHAARGAESDPSRCHLVKGSLEAIPVRDAWADLTICALAIGHLQSLTQPLAELHRVTRIGGTVLCSDFHPIGHALGWRRDFTVAGRRYAVRHTPYFYSDWQQACSHLGLRIVQVLEPRLDPVDIPAGARFDPIALSVPVVLVFELRRES